MSTTDANQDSSTDTIDPFSGGSGVRNCKEDALSDREFELLLEATQTLDGYQATEAKWSILATGRLGMRVGELIHMQRDWIDWSAKRIDIPRHEPCRKGRNGGICGYCRQHADQQAETDGNDVDEERAIKIRWKPKTAAAARSIPFDFDVRAEIAIEEYFDDRTQYSGSHSAVHRRISKVADRVDELDSDDVYPHALRATAASYHSARDIEAGTLQSLMGWKEITTATVYLQSSGERTQQSINAAHRR